jgi:hypothetical protein
MNPLEKAAESSVALKKAYSKPELLVYGDLRDITRHVGVAGKNDGNYYAPNKTH